MPLQEQSFENRSKVCFKKNRKGKITKRKAKAALYTLIAMAHWLRDRDDTVL